LDKGDGMTALRDLEHVANSHDSIKKLIKQIKDEASGGNIPSFIALIHFILVLNIISPFLI
jgi:hypothetical protein